jgi:DNA-binding MarR family transcriptional regulator
MSRKRHPVVTAPVSPAAVRRSRVAREVSADGKTSRTGGRASRGHGESQAPTFGPLLGYLGYQIRQTQTAIFRDLTVASADLGLTPGEYGLLAMVDANPGISQIDLAAVHKLDKSTLSLAVTRLAKRGLIRRARNPRDDRAKLLFLREAGSRLLAHMRECVEAQERAMDAVLRPGERELMLDALQRISHRLGR